MLKIIREVVDSSVMSCHMSTHDHYKRMIMFVRGFRMCEVPFFDVHSLKFRLNMILHCYQQLYTISGTISKNKFTFDAVVGDCN